MSPTSEERSCAIEVVRRDAEPRSDRAKEPAYLLSKEDIEHAPVHDDPRTWSRWRKVCYTCVRSTSTNRNISQTSILVIVSFACAINGLGANIYNRAYPLFTCIISTIQPLAVRSGHPANREEVACKLWPDLAQSLPLHPPSRRHAFPMVCFV